MRGFQLSLKDKGRTVIPTGLRRAGHFEEAEELIAIPLPEGGFVAKTRMQVLEELWSSLPEAGAETAVDELLRHRAEDEAAHIHRLDHPELPSEQEWELKSAGLYSKLGL